MRPLVFMLIAMLPGNADGGDPSKRVSLDPVTGEWIAEAPPVPGTAEGDYLLARQDFAREEYRSARKRLKKWFKSYDEANDLHPWARVLAARVDIAVGNLEKAHDSLESVMKEYAGTDLAHEAMSYDFVIAELYLSGKKRKFLGIPMLDGEDEGLQILDGIAAGMPTSELAEQAIKTKADHHFQKGEFELAELEYARLVQEFPRGRWVRFAELQSAKAALASFHGIDFDDAPLIEAEERFRRYLSKYPVIAEQEGVGQVLAQIRAQRASKELTIGQYYARTGYPESAAFYFQTTMSGWPDTPAAVLASEALAQLAAAPAKRRKDVPDDMMPSEQPNVMDGVQE